MTLQREGCSRVHDNSLDLETGADSKAVEPALSSAFARKACSLFLATLIENSNCIFYALAVGHIGDQHGIWQGNGHDVLEPGPDQFKPPALRAQQRVVAIYLRGIGPEPA